MEGSVSALNFDTYVNYVRPKSEAKDINSLLLAAVRQGKLDDIKKIVKDAGNDCFKIYVDSHRLIEEAVKHKRVCTLKLLIALGGVVDKPADPLSPLHIACKMGNLYLAHCLILAGADINKRDYNNGFPLHYAVQSNAIQNELSQYGRCYSPLYYQYISARLTLLLIESGAKYLNCTDRSGFAPLHYAVKAGNIEVVSILVENGADVNVIGIFGRTPLWLSVYMGNIDIARKLLDAGALTSVHDTIQLTPLALAVRENNYEMTLFLLNYFRKNNMLDDLLHKRSLEGEAPLHYAAGNLNKDIMGILIHFGAYVNIYNDKGFTPLSSVCYRNSCQSDIGPGRFIQGYLPYNPIVPFSSTLKDGSHICDYCLSIGYLIKKGAFVNHPSTSSPREKTPLHMAVKHNLFCAAKLLLHHGAVVDARDDDGLTPLHLSFEHQNLEMITLLLENGADPNCRGEEFLTPLHFATTNSIEARLKTIELLLDFDANVNSKNASGVTPLFLVLYSSSLNHQVIDIFLKNGADVFAESGFGTTPFSIAANSYLNQQDVGFGSNQITREMYYSICVHGVKMYAAFPKVIENLSSPDTSNYMWEFIEKSNVFGTFVQEVCAMKADVFYAETTFYDLLCLNVSSFSKRLRNNEFEKSFSTDDCLLKYPNYGPLINCKFLKALRKKNDMAAGQQFFARLSESHNYPRLPFICVEFILRHFKISDFRNISEILANTK